MDDALPIACPVCGNVFPWVMDLSPGRVEAQEPCPVCGRDLLIVLEVENGKVVLLEVEED